MKNIVTKNLVKSMAEYGEMLNKIGRSRIWTLGRFLNYCSKFRQAPCKW